MIPIRWGYFIENKYLKVGFDGFPDLSKQYEIANGPKSLPVLNSKGDTLFHIQQKEGKAFIGYDRVTLLLRALAIILLFLFLHELAEGLVKGNGFLIGYGSLLMIVFLLRLISYQFAFPFEYDKIPLFDPSIYASISFIDL